MSTEPEQRHRLGRAPALRLALGALLAVGLLQSVVELTREPIAAARQRLLEQTLSSLWPGPRGSTHPASDQIRLIAPAWLGTDRPLRVYRQAAVSDPAVVIEAIAPDGYAGEIRLLVGFDKPGQITAVRVTEHRETPGLGDAIEADKSDWILQFERRSRPAEASAPWRVDKDGGEFDTLAGATITSRAVVEAVQRVADLHAGHHAQILAAQAGSELHIEPATVSKQASRPDASE